MWGIVPAAGAGSRIQPLAFSKELLPVGSRLDGDRERPRAVSEYLLERMVLAGVTNVCFVIGPGKSDIIQYFGSSFGPARICYVVQEDPGGLCDAIFQVLPFIAPDEHVLVGLPDTIWFPEEALASLRRTELSFLLFPTTTPQFFDAVETDGHDRVRRIQVKHPEPCSSWIWGAFGMPARVLRDLWRLWNGRGQGDEYIGSLVNAYLEAGGLASAVRAGEAYVDVGTLDGYRQALTLLERRTQQDQAARIRRRGDLHGIRATRALQRTG